MKVLHFCNSFSTLSETFIYDQIMELEKQGVDNYVLTFIRLNETERPFDKIKIVKFNKGIIWLLLRIISKFYNKPSNLWPIKIKQIKKILNEINPDIIHAHFGPEGALITKLAKKVKVPLVVTFYGYDASSLLKQKFWLNEYKHIWENANSIIVLSKCMKNVLIDAGCPANKILIIHLSRNFSISEIKEFPKEIKSFLGIGRLTEKKGHLDTIKAIKKVLAAGYNVNLDIIGDGPLMMQLENYIQEYKLGNYIKLLGAVKSKDAIKLLYKADAFILCSKTGPDGDQEGTPTVLVEAQKIGLPCVSTFHAGIPEMIPEKNHKFLAEEGNIEQINNCIIKLIQSNKDELKEIIERGRKKVDEEFNLEVEVKKISELYNKMKN